MPSTNRSIHHATLAVLTLVLAIATTPVRAEVGAAVEEAKPPSSTSRAQYLEWIRSQAKALRDGDQRPVELSHWQARTPAIRAGLLKAWGGFPAEDCPLEARILGSFDRDGYRVEKLLIQTRPGVWMTANAYVPAGPGKHPAILAVHGHWPGAKQDPVVQARCIGAAKLGFFVLAVDAFGAGERGVGKALGEYHGEMTGATLLPTGLILSGLQVHENMRAVDYLKTRPEVDGENIGITGASGGGNQSMYAGAWDHRFKAVVPVCSVGNYPAYLGIAACICEIVPGVMRFAEEADVLGLTAPRGLMIVSASQDAYQFSVEAINHTLPPLKHIYKLFDKPHQFRHTIFEAKHDYNQAMREAMYGWMSLQLKDQGDGTPIPEPLIKPEAPETLRCYPGESRPDGWMTLPRFAAAEGRKLLAAKPWPNNLETWRAEAEKRRDALVETAFGGFPARPPVPLKILDQGETTTFSIESEPGMQLVASTTFKPKDAPLAIVIDPDHEAPDNTLVSAIRQAGWRPLSITLRATGEQTPRNDRIGHAPDHNSAEWALWIGRPLLGQWTFDVQRLLDAIEKSEYGLPTDVILIGKGAGGLVALSAGALDPRVTKVAAIDTLASYITDEPYRGQRLGVMAPGLLREVGDVAHLAALNAPKRLIIAGGVAGHGKPLTFEELNATYQPAAQTWKLLNASEAFRSLEQSTPAAVIEALR